jgi:maleylpyruvate isomerase
VTLHGFFRSGAAWRVRIALHLKGVAFDQAFHDLRERAQKRPEFRALNPQGLVPALDIGEGAPLTQSLAILEWLEETRPEPPLLPREPLARARVRAFALAIACDIHPVQNVGVLDRLRGLGLPEERVAEWVRGTVEPGLAACERLLPDHAGPFCFGTTPGLADLCLVPQLGNARRFEADLSRVPRLLAIEAACNALPAFAAALPAAQADFG